MRHPRDFRTAPDAPALVGAALVGVGLALELLLMTTGSPWWQGYGAICGHQSFAVAHCAGCYAAFGAVTAGLALAAMRPVRALNRAVARRSRSPGRPG